MAKKILITNPVLQHSHQLAMALNEAGHNVHLWTSTPLIGQNENPPFWIPTKYAMRLKNTSIPAIQRRHPPWAKIGLFIANKIEGEIGLRLNFASFRYFDKWVSKQLEKVMPDIIVGYEDFSYHTFQEANRLGIRCILDAPSIHHVTADKILGRHKNSFRTEINRRKDVELSLAERIICCSSMAAKTYSDNGVSQSKITPILLGAELNNTCKTPFRPHPNGKAATKFVFAGTLSKRKSVDLILDAFEEITKQGLKFELVFVGGTSGSERHAWLSRIESIPGATYLQNQSQPQLFDIFSNSDCLLLPSRFDAFGMVVAEAMACGIPAAVSSTTGAKEIIELHPGSGWIIQPKLEDIFDFAKRAILNPEILVNAKISALSAAKEFTWAAYHRRVADLFSEIG